MQTESFLAEGDLRSFSKRTTYFRSQLHASQSPPSLTVGSCSSQNTCGPPSTATTSGVCVTPGVSTSLSRVNTSVEESIHDVTSSSIGGDNNATSDAAAANGAANAFSRTHLVTNTNSIDRKLYFKKKKKTQKVSRPLFPFSQTQLQQNNSYASNTTLQSCTLNTTLNNSNVTLNLTTNTTLNTIAAINNINIANSIFGGQTAALFVKSTRPKDVATLYERAGETPLHHMRAMGLRRNDGVRSSRYYTCEPIMGDSLKRARYKKLNLDIETRRPASFDALRDWCSDDESLNQQELLTLHPVSPSVPPRPRIFLASTVPPTSSAVEPPAASANSDQPDSDNEITSAPVDTTDNPEQPLTTCRSDDPRTTPVLRRKLPRPEQLCLALSNKYPPTVVPIDVSGNGYRRMQKQRTPLVEVEFVRTRVGSSRRRRRKHLRRRNTIADAREIAGHSSKDCSSGRVQRCASLTSKARKSTRPNLTAQPQPSTSSGRGASSSPSEGCYSTDGPSFDPSFDASEPSDYCSFVCRRLPKPTQILGVAVALPTPPQHVLTPQRRLPKRANTFRDDVEDDEGVTTATLHTSPDPAPDSTPSCSHASDQNTARSPSSDQLNRNTSSTSQGPNRFGGADLQRPKLRDEDRVLRDEGARSSSGNWSASSSARTSLDLDVQNRNFCGDLVNQSLQQTFDETTDWSYRNFESDCFDSDALDSLGISLIAGKGRLIHGGDADHTTKDDNGNPLIPSSLPLFERNDDSEHPTVSERSESSNLLRRKEDLQSGSKQFDERDDSSKVEDQNSSDSTTTTSSSSNDSSAPRKTSAVAAGAQRHTGDGGSSSRSLTPSGKESPALSFGLESAQPSESTAPQSSPSSAQRTHSRTTDDLPSSSSFTSDGTLTPTQDIQDIPFFDDDTSSAYSCDTEGYYTSFHIDSGLRSACSYEDTKLATSASDSETPGGGLGGGGSRSASGSIAGSISNSSAASLGTVIMRNPEKKTPPKPPQRVSSLDRKNSTASNRESIITVIHVNGSAGSSREDLVASSGSETADSGRETSSSATEPTSPRQTSAFCADVAAAELERKDSFRLKTTINASGIPSMCVITPPISDDESVRSAPGSKNSSNSSGSDDPALGSVAAKAMLFQGGSVGAGSGSVRQVPRIETSKTPPKSDPQQTPPTGTSAGSQTSTQNKGPVKALFHSTSVDYSVNVRPSAIKQSDITRRLSGDGQVAATSPSNTSVSQKEIPAAQTAPVAPPPRIHKVPPPPPPREDSIDSSTARKVEAYKPSVGEASTTTPPTASPRYTLQHQQQQIQLPQQLQSQMQIPNAASVEEVQPFSAVPPSVKQNLVITPTNSLERKRLKATAGAHVTLDSEGKVVYSSDSLPRSQKSLAANDGVRPGNGSLHTAGPSIASGGTLPPGISSIQQMPLPPPPVESAPAIPELPVQVANSVNSSAAALQQHQQHIQQQLLQQQQQQQQMLRQEQEEKLQRHRQEELLLQRAVQQQIDQSKQEMLQQQSALKQQHQELQQQLHETRLELQRQQQEQQQKLQALRERQAYLQSKTPSKNSTSTPSDKKQSKQAQKEQNSKEAKLKQEQQQRLLQQQQQTQQQLVIEQQKQLQLAEQQKQLQLQKQQQQQQLQYQQQQIIQQQQQYQLQQQQHGVYGTRQDPYLFPSMPQSNALSQIPPIVPPPPPADPRQPPEGMGSSTAAPGGVILPSSGAPMSPRSQRAGAYVHVQAGEQMSALQQQQFQQQQQLQQHQQQQQSQVPQNSQYPSRPHSAQGMYSASLAQQQQQQQTSNTPGPTSRAPTPIQGAVTSSPRHSPFTAASTPQQLQQQLLQQQHQQLSLQQQPGQQQLQGTPGVMYGSQRSLQNFGLANDTASGFPSVVGQGVLQHPRLPTTAPPYPSQPLTDSDIYGRIGMTRQVQVGGTLPSGFGRHQRGYTSLPPSKRGQMQLPGSDDGRGGEGNSGKTGVSRRASVAGDAGSRGNRGSAASNPSTPEKLLEKEKKLSKKEKDKDKKKKDNKEKDKDKEKENKDGKSEKSPKKKWFWTLPLRRKKKTKDENSEDDDGGFKAASEKGTRKLMPPQNSSFMRYPSPDTASSDLNSSHSSDVSSMEHSSSYRSSPSSEVNYYSQRAQYLHQQQQAHQQHLLQLQHQQHQQLLQQQMQAQHQQQLLQQQQQQQQQHQQQQPLNAGANLRSLPTTPISSPDGQGSFVSSSPLTMNSDVTDLTTDVSRTRQYMSRDQMYSAMRHPQYYNYNRHSYAGSATQASAADEANNNSNSTPSSSRSTSPAVFGISPLPSNTVRPQVRDRIAHNDDYVSRESQDTPIPFIFKENGFEELKFCKVDPPAGYGAAESGSISPEGDDNDHENCSSTGSAAMGTSTVTSAKPFSKQTTLFDFKKMILQQSMNTAGGKERISAVEMLKASRPSIYGYAPPPAPIIKPSQHKEIQQPPQTSKLQPKTTIEGVIMPPTSRNTARALLFQSRFGSGRRYRASKTDIISTTILEDHDGELSEEADMEESEEEEEEEEGNVCSPSKRNLRGSLARAYSEPEGAIPSSLLGMSSPSSSPSKDRSNVPHSTPNPNKTGSMPPLSVADVSCIGDEEGKTSPPNNSVKAENGTNSSTDESMETAL